jgi:hypothetical protein
MIQNGMMHDNKLPLPGHRYSCGKMILLHLQKKILSIHGEPSAEKYFLQ